MRKPKRGRKSEIAASVVSGTYNRLDLLKEMVGSARQSAGDLGLEIVVVDGGSTDGTTDWCGTQPDITLVEHGELLGAIRAYNDGFAAASGKYIIIGNDDIVFDHDTIARAYDYMEDNPQVGQGAFGHKYLRRGAKQPTIQGAMGYPYGQCSIIPKWLGDYAGWWGDEGMRTYGGDTRLSLRLWEMGWPVKGIPGCSVTDREHDDELRVLNSDTPRRSRAVHPDLSIFNTHWKDRLPHKSWWIPAPTNRLVMKAARGRLRSMRFKSGMFVGAPTRTGLIYALSQYGPIQQVNQTEKMAKIGRPAFQHYACEAIAQFRPDLVIFQVQRDNNITVETVKAIKKQNPNTYLVNWDGDTHPTLAGFNYEIARAVDLQLVVSPTIFPLYAEKGIAVGYWPIGIEQEYIDQERAEDVDGPDVIFLGALYGEGVFPEAEFRRDAVVALSESDLQFALYGPGWPKVGLKTTSTSEQHGSSAALYAGAKMALSISQDKGLWGYTSDRLYNICATGCPALVQRFAGMEQHGYVDGQTCIAFSNIDEMLEKAHHYAEHDEERERIGQAGQGVTLERHTWEARIPGLLTMLEDA